MGGIGYITAFLADISKNNILINAHMLEASKQNDVKRYLFSSSACVYAQSKQKNAEVTPLKEEDAYPADPEPGYGWEKLFAEELCRYYYHGLQLRDAHRALPQRLRAARHLRRRQGKVSGSHLAAKLPRLKTAAPSRSGATASRPVPTCTWTIASKA